jgi:hypothetical protein
MVSSAAVRASSCLAWVVNGDAPRQATESAVFEHARRARPSVFRGDGDDHMSPSITFRWFVALLRSTRASNHVSTSLLPTYRAERAGRFYSGARLTLFLTMCSCRETSHRAAVGNKSQHGARSGSTDVSGQVRPVSRRLR